MKSEIYGSVMPMVEIQLERGELIYAQTGAMQWMSEDIDMQTNMRGGVFGALKRSVTGENLFLAHFTAENPGATVAFGHSFPGKIIELDVSQKPMVCQKRAFLCATEGVDFDVEFQKKLSTGFFGGEGFIMQRLSGRGTAWVELDGEYVVKELKPGEKIRMETGALGMYEAGMNMSIQMVKGFKNMFLGGEGLFLTTIEGPGKVWIQTMPAANMASEISRFLPTRNDSK